MKLKKILAMTLAAVVAAGSWSISAFAETDASGKFEYVILEDGTVSIIGYNGEGVIDIPEILDGYAVTEIGYGAFVYNEEVTGIVIPDGVTTIGQYIIEGCVNITEVNVPASVTEIGAGAFNSTGVTAITVDENNKNYTSVDGVLFNKDKTILVEYPLGKEAAEYTVPEGVEAIGDNAFEISALLTKVTVTEGVTEIGEWAFASCVNLTEIILPDSLTSIGDNAFAYCESLTEITIPESVTAIDDYVFAGCSSLTAINVSENNKYYSSLDGVLFNKDKTEIRVYPAKKEGAYVVPESVTSIGDGAFHDCESLTEITISDNVTSIGGVAFWYCTSLTTIELPAGVTEIGVQAFDYCYNLTAINVSEDNVNYASIDGVLFNKDITEIVCYPIGKGGKTYVIPDSVTSIGAVAFSHAPFTEFTIPSGVTTIEILAFIHCESLTSIEIPDSVTTIGDRAFGYCRALTSIVIPASVTTIVGDPFYECSSLYTIYGYAGSAAETYANEYGINFTVLEEDSQPSTGTTTTTAATTEPETTTTAATTATTTTPAEELVDEDEATGVQLLAAEGVIAEGVEMSVKIGTADIDTNAKIYILDITLVNAANEKVQPNGYVTVKIPLPEGFDEKDTYYVFYQADDGSLTNMNAVFENGYVSFTTKHFSTYILTNEDLEDASPNTGVTLLLIPAIAAAAGVIISKKRK